LCEAQAAGRSLPRHTQLSSSSFQNAEDAVMQFATALLLYLLIKKD
jgi:hypothetical protein